MKTTTKITTLIFSILALTSLLTSCGPSGDELKSIVLDFYPKPYNSSPGDIPMRDILETSFKDAKWSFGQEGEYNLVILEGNAQLLITGDTESVSKKIVFMIHKQNKTVDLIYFPDVEEYAQQIQFAVVFQQMIYHHEKVTGKS